VTTEYVTEWMYVWQKLMAAAEYLAFLKRFNKLSPLHLAARSFRACGMPSTEEMTDKAAAKVALFLKSIVER
jgi:hypothetical protein